MRRWRRKIREKKNMTGNQKEKDGKRREVKNEKEK